MPVQLDTIGSRLTPSTPLQITYGSQSLAVGRKFATMFAHMTSTPPTGLPYTVYTVTNVGDPAAAQAEVDAIAGTGSQAGKMAFAFVNSNVLAGNSNFPAFRICFLASTDTAFGSSQQAINAIKNIRSDAIITPYAAESSANLTLLINLAILISGADRDLKGQFGTFIHAASLTDAETQQALDINSQYCIVHSLPDSNTALVTESGVLTAASNIITGLASTVGINKNAVIAGTGVPAGAIVGVVTKTTVSMVDAAGEALNAAANEASESITFQNVVSQPVEIVAAACAAGVMSSLFPYNPFQNVTVGGLIPPQIQSDLIDWDPAGSSEAFLQAGLAPLCVAPDGETVVFVRVRTTYATTPANVTVTAYFDWIDIVKLYDFREVVYQIAQNPPFNNNPGGTLASVTMAAKFKDEVIREAILFEQQGAFQNVKQMSQLFVVSVSSVGRFDCYIPEQVVPGLYVIAGNIQGLVAASSTTV